MAGKGSRRVEGALARENARGAGSAAGAGLRQGTLHGGDGTPGAGRAVSGGGAYPGRAGDGDGAGEGAEPGQRGVHLRRRGAAV